MRALSVGVAGSLFPGSTRATWPWVAEPSVPRCASSTRRALPGIEPATTTGSVSLTPTFARHKLHTEMALQLKGNKAVTIAQRQPWDKPAADSTDRAIGDTHRHRGHPHGGLKLPVISDRRTHRHRGQAAEPASTINIPNARHWLCNQQQSRVQTEIMGVRYDMRLVLLGSAGRQQVQHGARDLRQDR